MWCACVLKNDRRPHGDREELAHVRSPLNSKLFHFAILRKSPPFIPPSHGDTLASAPNAIYALWARHRSHREKVISDHISLEFRKLENQLWMDVHESSFGTNWGRFCEYRALGNWSPFDSIITSESHDDNVDELSTEMVPTRPDSDHDSWRLGLDMRWYEHKRGFNFGGFSRNCFHSVSIFSLLRNEK